MYFVHFWIAFLVSRSPISNLYVVDNASKDNSADVVNEIREERVRFIANSENRGVAEGNNQGARAALEDGCETVLLLNNDTEFPMDLFSRLYSALEESRCDMATGKILYFEPSDRIWCAGGWFDPKRFYGAFHFGMGEEDSGQFDAPRRVTYAPTCCLLVRRSVFQRIGMMDSKYFVYNDDVDFLYRCLRQDIALWYAPEAETLPQSQLSHRRGRIGLCGSVYDAESYVFYTQKLIALACSDLGSSFLDLDGAETCIVWSRFFKQMASPLYLALRRIGNRA